MKIILIIPCVLYFPGVVDVVDAADKLLRGGANRDLQYGIFDVDSDGKDTIFGFPLPVVVQPSLPQGNNPFESSYFLQPTDPGTDSVDTQIYGEFGDNPSAPFSSLQLTDPGTDPVSDPGTDPINTPIFGVFPDEDPLMYGGMPVYPGLGGCPGLAQGVTCEGKPSPPFSSLQPTDPGTDPGNPLINGGIPFYPGQGGCPGLAEGVTCTGHAPVICEGNCQYNTRCNAVERAGFDDNQCSDCATSTSSDFVGCAAVYDPVVCQDGCRYSNSCAARGIEC
jgi:hypothetical protein